MKRIVSVTNLPILSDGFMDILDRLKIEARREPHEPIWRDAIVEIETLRSVIDRRISDIRGLVADLGETQWELYDSPHNSAVRELRKIVSA